MLCSLYNSIYQYKIKFRRMVDRGDKKDEYVFMARLAE